jgi:hypothetical protein
MSNLAEQNLCTIREVFSSNYGQVTRHHSSSLTCTHACMLSLSVCQTHSHSLSLSLPSLPLSLPLPLLPLFVFHICTPVFLLCLQINQLSLNDICKWYIHHCLISFRFITSLDHSYERAGSVLNQLHLI